MQSFHSRSTSICFAWFLPAVDSLSLSLSPLLCICKMSLLPVASLQSYFRGAHDSYGNSWRCLFLSNIISAKHKHGWNFYYCCSWCNTPAAWRSCDSFECQPHTQWFDKLMCWWVCFFLGGAGVMCFSNSNLITLPISLLHGILVSPNFMDIHGFFVHGFWSKEDTWSCPKTRASEIWMHVDLVSKPHVLIRNNGILFACGIMWLRRNYLYKFFFLKDELWVLIIV